MDGFADAGERVFGDEGVAGLAEEQADGGVVIGCLDLGVHGGEVEVELAGVPGFEGVGLESHDDVACGGVPNNGQWRVVFMTEEFKK